MHLALRSFYPTITLGILYFIAGKVSLAFLHGHEIVNIGIFASEGIALGFILYFGTRVWSGIFIGQFALAFSNDIALSASLGIAAINTFEALIAYYLFYRFKLNTQLTQFKDIFGLIGIILFIQIFSAFFSNTILLFHDVITKQDFLDSCFSWWFGNVMGQFLFTPYLLLLFHNYKNIKLTEYFSYIFFSGVFIYTIEILLNITNTMLLLSFSIPFVVFIVSYKGFTYGATISVILAFITSYAVYLGTGAFHLENTLDNVINYNLYILAHISMVLITGVLFEERKRNLETLEERVQKEIAKNKEQELFLLQQSRLAQMGEMIAMIAHQWRQPLNNLSLANQLLISKYNKGKLTTLTMDTFKENSKKQITHMSQTIDDFRNFFKPNDKKQDFNVNNVIYDILNIAQSLYTTNSIALTFKYDKEFYSNGYPNKLGQALLNIINNAKDALAEKNQKEKFIKILLSHTKEHLLISIEDNAGGIDESIADKIFDPYFSTKESKNGTGLGLYMTKMIIEDKLNGRIDFSNTKEGVKFNIYLKEQTDAT